MPVFLLIRQKKGNPSKKIVVALRSSQLSFQNQKKINLKIKILNQKSSQSQQ